VKRGGVDGGRAWTLAWIVKVHGGDGGDYGPRRTGGLWDELR
jgi:hypothetical protein